MSGRIKKAISILALLGLALGAIPVAAHGITGSIVGIVKDLNGRGGSRRNGSFFVCSGGIPEISFKLASALKRRTIESIGRLKWRRY